MRRQEFKNLSVGTSIVLHNGVQKKVAIDKYGKRVKKLTRGASQEKLDEVNKFIYPNLEKIVFLNNKKMKNKKKLTVDDLKHVEGECKIIEIDETDFTVKVNVYGRVLWISRRAFKLKKTYKNGRLVFA